ncbi:MAG: hypothetical protein QMD95_02970 [Candidatus Hodarchaeaceae archaeon]|nr:hypothetical protein [Candidatus Hodarchaeaceae archaeon]
MQEYIYEEKIYPRLHMVFDFIAACFIITITILTFREVPSQFIVPILFMLVFVIVTWMVFDVLFCSVKIKISSEAIIISILRFKLAIPWQKIQDCYLDKSSFIRYLFPFPGITRAGGKWRSHFVFDFGPRVVLVPSEKLHPKARSREIVFTTRNPEKVIWLIKNNISKE